jgi:hypothetical protein
MLRRVALVRTDVSEERVSSIIRVTRIAEPGTLAVTSNRSKLRRNVPPNRPFLQESHGVTSQKKAFFVVTAVKTSNFTKSYIVFLAACNIFLELFLTFPNVCRYSVLRSGIYSNLCSSCVASFLFSVALF